MFIHNNIQNIQTLQTLFEILPNEIILGILFHVFRDNDDDIRSAIPYLIPFLNDPVSQSKRRFKPKIIGWNNYPVWLPENTAILIYELVEVRPIFSRIIQECKNGFERECNHYFWNENQNQNQSIKSYRTTRKQEMKFRNKQQRNMVKCSRR